MSQSSNSAPGGVHGGRKAGRKPAFTADDVIAAAIAEGIDRFTLSAVAERLGVATGAIYRLFASREDLVIACLDTAGATLAVPRPGMRWRQTLGLWADECWRVCEEYPGLDRLLFAMPTAPARINHVFVAYVANLAEQGRSAGQAMFALDFLGDTVIASHLGVDGLRRVDESGVRGLDRMREQLTELPDGAESVMRPDERWTSRAVLDTKIDFILTGLEHNWPEM